MEACDEADGRAEIARLLARQDVARSAGDAGAFCAAMAPEVTFTNGARRFAAGPAAFVEEIRDSRAGMYKGSVYRQRLEAIAFVLPDAVGTRR